MSTLTGNSFVESETTVTSKRLKLAELLTKTPTLSCVGGDVAGPLKLQPDELGQGDNELMSAMQTSPTTVTVMEAEWTRAPFAPRTVMVNTAPTVAKAGTDIVNVEFPSPRAGRLTVAGLKPRDGPDGEADALSWTGPAKPVMLVRVMVAPTEVPAPTFSDSGAAPTPKSVTPAVMVCRCVMEPLALFIVIA